MPVRGASLDGFLLAGHAAPLPAASAPARLTLFAAPGAFAAAPQSKATLFEATLRSFRDVVRREGVRGLYRGFAMFTFGGLPSQG